MLATTLVTLALCAIMLHTSVGQQNPRVTDRWNTDLLQYKVKEDDRNKGLRNEGSKGKVMIPNRTGEDYVTKDEMDAAIGRVESEIDAITSEMDKLIASVHDELESQGNTIASIQSKLEESKVAFFAYGIASSEGQFVYLDKYQIVRYYYTKMNDGGYYSTSTGKFKCPVSGKYFFSFSVHATGIKNQSPIGNAAIMRDGELMSQLYFANTDGGEIVATLSSSAMVDCSSGQYVWVETVHNGVQFFNWSSYNVFNGMLIYAS